MGPDSHLESEAPTRGQRSQQWETPSALRHSAGELLRDRTGGPEKAAHCPGGTGQEAERKQLIALAEN